MGVGSTAAFSVPVDLAVLGLELVFGAAGFVIWPLGFAFGGAGLRVLGGLLGSVFSCVLLDEAAVGRIMRSRKLPLAGAAGFLLTCEVRDSGLAGCASEDRGVGRAEEVLGFGLVAVDALPLKPLVLMVEALPLNPLVLMVEPLPLNPLVLMVDALPLNPPVLGAADAGSCFALEAAVGAVRREGKLIAFVPSLGLTFELSDCLLVVETVRSDPAALATDAAVGAVSELRLAFFVGSLVETDLGDSVFGTLFVGSLVETDLGDSVFEVLDVLAESGVFGWLAGDLMLLDDGLAGDFVEMEAGLPLGDAFAAGFFADFRALSSDFVAGACVVSPLVFGADSASSARSLWPFGRKSSATGGKASPPLTACSFAGSAGFITAGSSSAAVVGLSGFAGSLSSLCANGLSSTASSSCS